MTSNSVTFAILTERTAVTSTSLNPVIELKLHSSSQCRVPRPARYADFSDDNLDRDAQFIALILLDSEKNVAT
jgi:hypothetical protein